MDNQNLQNLAFASPFAAIILYFLDYFMRQAKEAQKENKIELEKRAERDKQDAVLLKGFKDLLRELIKSQDEILRKIDDLTKRN